MSLLSFLRSLFVTWILLANLILVGTSQKSTVISNHDQKQTKSALNEIIAAGEKMAHQEKEVFPEVEGSNLNGREFSLPKDFEGNLNLVLIAFYREQQEMVNTWFPIADSLSEAFDDFRYYELPTLTTYNPLYRWFIDRGMRSGISDPVKRAQTITLYLDKEAFRKSLSIPTEETIYAFVVDQQGKILWRTDGEATSAKVEALKKCVEQREPELSPSFSDQSDTTM